MKKQLLFLAMLIVFGTAIAQDSYWNRFKQQFGFGNPLPIGYPTGYDDPRYKELIEIYELPTSKGPRKHARLQAYRHYVGEQGGLRQGRYEGTRNTALLGIAAAGIGYGLHYLYNRYKGVYQHLKNKVTHIDKGITDLINYKDKNNKDDKLNFLNDQIEFEIDNNGSKKAMNIREAQLFFRKIKDEIHLQESQQKKK